MINRWGKDCWEWEMSSLFFGLNIQFQGFLYIDPRDRWIKYTVDWKLYPIHLFIITVAIFIFRIDLNSVLLSTVVPLDFAPSSLGYREKSFPSWCHNNISEWEGMKTESPVYIPEGSLTFLPFIALYSSFLKHFILFRFIFIFLTQSVLILYVFFTFFLKLTPEVHSLSKYLYFNRSINLRQI